MAPMARKKHDDGFDNFRRLDRILGHVLDLVKIIMWLVVLSVLVAALTFL